MPIFKHVAQRKNKTGLGVRRVGCFHVGWIIGSTKPPSANWPLLLLFLPDINELNLPKTCEIDFSDQDDLLNFKLVICPDEVSGWLRGEGLARQTRRFWILSSSFDHGKLQWWCLSCCTIASIWSKELDKLISSSGATSLKLHVSLLHWQVVPRIGWFFTSVISPVHGEAGPLRNSTTKIL